MVFCLLGMDKKYFCKGNNCPTNLGSLNFQLDGTILSHPVGKVKFPYSVRQNCLRLGESLNFQTRWDKIVPDWSEVKTSRLGGVS